MESYEDLPIDPCFENVRVVLNWQNAGSTFEVESYEDLPIDPCFENVRVVLN